MGKKQTYSNALIRHARALHEYEQLQYSEVAKRIGWTINYTKSILHYNLRVSPATDPTEGDLNPGAYVLEEMHEIKEKANADVT